MKVHPLADLFPQIEGRELEELVDDIRNNGLRVPIVLDREGRLLDGRNRLRACRAAGVEPRFETWDGRGAVAELIVSLNLKRRHRAMLAAKLRERKGLFDSRTNWSSGNSADQTAALLNVSPMSVKRAAKLLRSGDRKLITRSGLRTDAGGLPPQTRRTHRTALSPPKANELDRAASTTDSRAWFGT